MKSSASVRPQVIFHPHFIQRFLKITVIFHTPLSHSLTSLIYWCLSNSVWINSIIIDFYRSAIAGLRAPPAKRPWRDARVKRAMTVKTRTQSRCLSPGLPSLYRLLVQFFPVWFRCFKLLSSAILTPVQNNRTRLTSRTPLHSCAFLYHGRARRVHGPMCAFITTSSHTSEFYPLIFYCNLRSLLLYTEM